VLSCAEADDLRDVVRRMGEESDVALVSALGSIGRVIAASASHDTKVTGE
jgi:hypothetical protein